MNFKSYNSKRKTFPLKKYIGRQKFYYKDFRLPTYPYLIKIFLKLVLLESLRMYTPATRSLTGNSMFPLT